MLAVKLWEKIETDYLMSWLSTLGGAFSALGEQFSQCVSFFFKELVLSSLCLSCLLF